MLIPATRYRDPEAALDFLTRVPGLATHAVYRDAAGAITHAELALGTGLMMLGPERAGDFDGLMVSPAETGGRETTVIHAVVGDIAMRHARAVAAGADIVLPLAEQPQGGSSFTLRDAEGHVWTLGDDDPMAAR